MKAVLVIDMPDVCCSTNKICDLCVDRDWGPICAKTGRDVLWEQKPDWCPLRPLPEKRNTTSLIETKHEAEENHVTPQHQAGFNLGWNACLEAITGGKEE